MSTTSTPEMRLVHTDDGWATAINRRQSGKNIGLAILLLLLVTVGGLGVAAGTGIEPLIPAAMLSGVLPFLGMMTMAYTRIRLHRSGIEIGTLSTRSANPSIDEVRDGKPKLPGFSVESGPEHQLGFSEIRAMGYTDYSIWFDMPDGRVEVPLEHTRRDDIARLHDAIHESWQRFLQGIEQTEDQAGAERRRLAGLARQAT